MLALCTIANNLEPLGQHTEGRLPQPLSPSCTKAVFCGPVHVQSMLTQYLRVSASAADVFNIYTVPFKST